MHRPNPRPRIAAHDRGVTLVEIMIVVAIIAALVGILLPALGIVRRNAELVSSQSNLRSVGALMSAYSLDNRDHVVPSQFDYSSQPGRSSVRGASPQGTNPNVGALLKGSWTDILWTTGKFGPLAAGQLTDAPSPTWDYRFDSPDHWAYEDPGMVEGNPFRSKAPLRKPSILEGESEEPRPFGPGTAPREVGQPGYFAANDFFDCRPPAGSPAGTMGRWYTNAMIRFPAISAYAVDSKAGETIPLPSQANAVDLAGASSSNADAWLPAQAKCEVDFRYVGDVCCLLYLDAHVGTQSKWIDLNDLQVSRQTRIERLDQRN